ncbi:LAME_0G17370g1_1 [Lachancea meyersii CBS 8951]|uniref:LAME_0G17370g1_1 n=1 Tax=Lachancea meyersii CBS 8951 TaxID=1266667 RepID=A0A1G4KBG2_9SACH|nr:LAME_0G17370g1_1 [Lachancea meyersii CBS 8951]
MCGRYALDCTAGELDQRFTELGFDFENARQPDTSQVQPSFNVAPTNTAPVYTHHKKVRDMKWGLIPHWVSEVSKSQPYKTFNARCENIASSKMWTTPCNYKRCVVPVSGYFEWLTKGKKKIPYYVTRKDRELMFLAGMYDHVESHNLYTFTIITAPAPSNMEWLHTRMPVVLNWGSKQWKAWLEDSKTQWTESELQAVLQAQCNENELEWWQVSSDVGKVSNNGKYLVAPAKAPIREMFKKEAKTTTSLAKSEESPDLPRDEQKPNVKTEEAEEESKPVVRESGQELEKGLKEQLTKPEAEKEIKSKPGTKRRNNDITQMLCSKKRVKH